MSVVPMVSRLPRDRADSPRSSDAAGVRTHQEPTGEDRHSRDVHTGRRLRSLVLFRAGLLEGIGEHESPGRDVLRGHLQQGQEGDVHRLLQEVGERRRSRQQALEVAVHPVAAYEAQSSFISPSRQLVFTTKEIH